MRYFFEIQYLPESNVNGALAARCISILHGTVCREKYSIIGISFPEWSDIDVGNRIAFVSQDKVRLLRFSKHFDLKTLEQENVITISELKEVPPKVAEVQFIRNNGIAKLSLAERQRRIKRCVERAKKAGREYQPKHDYKDRNFGSYHKLILASQSTERSFPLYIQKKSVSHVLNCDFSHYGLAANELYIGTVPDLSFHQ